MISVGKDRRLRITEKELKDQESSNKSSDNTSEDAASGEDDGTTNDNEFEDAKETEDWRGIHTVLPVKPYAYLN